MRSLITLVNDNHMDNYLKESLAVPLIEEVNVDDCRSYTYSEMALNAGVDTNKSTASIIPRHRNYLFMY